MEPEPELISGEEKKEEQKSERFIATTSSYKRKKLKTCFQLKRSALIILDSSAVEQNVSTLLTQSRLTASALLRGTRC